MAFLLSSERPAAAAMPFSPMRHFAGWFIALFAERARKQALNELLAMEPTRLRDLGIDRRDVIDALHNRAIPAGRQLHAARARNCAL